MAVRRGFQTRERRKKCRFVIKPVFVRKKGHNTSAAIWGIKSLKPEKPKAG